MLESMAAVEKKMLTEAVEEEKEKVQNLEKQIKQLTEQFEKVSYCLFHRQLLKLLQLINVHIIYFFFEKQV